MTPVSFEVEDAGPLAPTGLRARVNFLLPTCVLYAADKLLSLICGALHIGFPPALIGMGCIVAALLAATARRPSAAAAATTFFRPGCDFVHAWLPIWYIPAIVTIPLAIHPISGATLGIAAALVLVGVPLVLLFTAGVALLVRRATQTEMMELIPFHAARLDVTWIHWCCWGALAALSLLAIAMEPRVTAQWSSFPLLLSATVLGYLGGVALPARVQQVVHPILVCGAAPNAAAALQGLLTGAGYWATLHGYVTQGQGGVYGPGDLLFSFLGVVILTFGFKVFEQWGVMRRHAAEILLATSSSALFAMLSTACMARLAGLPADVARGMVPRSVTMALALPIAAQLGAPLPVTAAAVALTGTAGSLVVGQLLSVARVRDPIARGMAAAAGCHGFGVAALSAREPETLPYGALAYAMCGVMASAWAALPPVRHVLLAITG